MAFELTDDGTLDTVVRCTYKTPEDAHSTLIDAIEYELSHYGPSSLAEICACMCEARYDEDDPRESDGAWKTAAESFRRLAENIATLKV